MAQKKKKGKPPQKKETKRRMSTSQKIMGVVGIFIVLAMILPYILQWLVQ